MTVRCDLFCAVVDNLGDAAVCWRLARQLAGEYGWTVRLWIDDREPLALLHPGVAPGLARQSVDGVEIRHWSTPFADAAAADVVVEAFACDLPDAYLEAMAQRPQPPVWLNLEYLSAEDWVDGCHLRPSPHPDLPLMKYFFFPGFTAGTGGLIRERDLIVPPAPASATTLTVSLFCYDNPVLPALLETWTGDEQTLHCRVAAGLPRRQVETWLGEAFPVGTIARRGQISLEAMPFVPQRDYDGVLATCGLNFVRGEDSFVRAQWACRPLVWQIYPQAHGSHQAKLEAFLDRYRSHLPTAVGDAASAFWRAWNGWGDIGETWPAFRTVLPALSERAGRWAEEIARPRDLAANLVKFCLERI